MNAKSVGSSQAQIEGLSVDIKNIEIHLKTHAKDHSAKYGLRKKISRRKAHEKYIKRKYNKEN